MFNTNDIYIIQEFYDDKLGDFRRYKVRYTPEEYATIRQAIRQSHRFFEWRNSATIMGPELEDIVCGGRPDRYELLPEPSMGQNYVDELQLLHEECERSIFKKYRIIAHAWIGFAIGVLVKAILF